MSNSRNLRFFLSTLAAALMVLAWTGASRADLTLSWSETSPAQAGSTLAGTVTFHYDATNSLLDITLKNTGSAAGHNPDILNGLLFNVAGSPTLSATSANLTSGSNLIDSSNGNTVSGTAANGWGLSQGSGVSSSTSGIYPTATNYAVQAAGFSFPSGTGITGQSNFGNSTSQNLDGGDYGIVNGVVTGSSNKINTGFSPLVSNSMSFVLDNYTGQAITDVVVQYGTAIGPNSTEPFIPLTTVPEPSTTVIAALGTLGFLGYGLRRRKAK